MAKPRSIQQAKHIFVYNNIRTNQVLYSLTRALDNNASLHQLPYLGKKTVPARLRKDLWQPLATITFPDPSRCLHALRELREFRKLHELSYSRQDIRKGGSNPELLKKKEDEEEETNCELLGKKERKLREQKAKKERGKRLMDQKANSIADIAAVLIRQQEYQTAMATDAALGKKKGEGEMLRGIRLGETRASAQGPAAMEGRLLGSQGTTEVAADEKDMGEKYEHVTIRWKNILDAEYASDWPSSVIHDGLDYNRHTAPAPS